MTKITIEVDNCQGCPHFTTANQWSSDGWDRMEDWVCSKASKKIQSSVEWHEESKIPVPEWCPIRVPARSIDALDFINKSLEKSLAEEMLRNNRPKHRDTESS